MARICVEIFKRQSLIESVFYSLPYFFCIFYFIIYSVLLFCSVRIFITYILFRLICLYVVKLPKPYDKTSLREIIARRIHSKVKSWQLTSRLLGTSWLCPLGYQEFLIRRPPRRYYCHPSRD